MAALDIDAILAAAELPQSSVTLCLKGSLVAEYERLDAQLRDLGPTVAASLGDVSPAAGLTSQMQALREQMLAHEAAFTLRALPAREASNLRAQIPEKKDGQADEEHADAYHAWVCDLLARTCGEPKMTAEQADQLCGRLSSAQWNQLINSAWLVNFNRVDVPFSDAAFAQTLISDARSRRQPEQESPDHGSLAGHPPSEPPASTETTDD